MIRIQTARARRLRRDMTDVERRLWQRLRERQLGARFRRQAPIGPYIADFVAFEERLVIELDGGQHAEAGQATHDLQRTAFLEAAGFLVVRFWNNEVLNNIDGVLQQIHTTVATQAGAPSQRPRRPNPASQIGANPAPIVPSPLVGEGQDGGGGNGRS